MIIDEDAVDTFLEHHGVKGQKWGVRSTGRSITNKAKKVGAFIGRHKQGIGTAAAGAAFVGTIVVDKQLRASHPTKSIQSGSSWIQNHQAHMKNARSAKIKGFTFVTSPSGATSKLSDLEKAQHFSSLLHS